MLFSVLFNVNILMSTVTLNMVSMALHQIIRALVPAFTVMLMLAFFGTQYRRNILFSLGVIFAGVFLYAAKGEVDYTGLGLLLTLLGTFLAALKGVVTNLFMVGSLRLHPLDLLVYMSVYAALQMAAVLLFTGSLQTSIAEIWAMEDPKYTTGVIGINGLCAVTDSP
jgi:hypothetical protein